MMDLHAWITRQVDNRERVALKARTDIASLLASGDIDNRFAERHIAANDPVTVLRRCEADRRILARHRRDPDCLAWASCKGCGNDDWGLPNVENQNDCPELLDLAHAHGITDEILAGLDRPELEPHKTARLWGMPTLTGPQLLGMQAYTPMREVPEALRGPRWKP